MAVRRFGLSGKMLRTCCLAVTLGGTPWLAGCGRHAGAAPHTDLPTTVPTGPQTYSNEKQHIQITYPGDWTPKENKEVTFYVVPAASPSGSTAMTLDIPNIPIHIPGMVTMSRVEKGFLDDLKKDAPKAQIIENKPFDVPASKAKRIRATWDVNGAGHTQDAVVIVHSDQVYILEIECPTEQYEGLKAMFDGVVASVKWMEKK